MHEMSNLKYILQVRSGSTRLPQKMQMPFSDGKTIPELIISKLIASGIQKENIIIATTINSLDDSLANYLSNLGCIVYRGDENNVLNRFIHAAKFYNATHVVRICADNPFLNIGFLNNMVSLASDGNFDYISYQMQNGTPAIKTHYGLFCEFVSLSALEKIASLSTASLDTEHVTPFIYNNPDQFSIKMLSIPLRLQENDWIRLTIDTREDFELAQSIYSKVIADDYESIIEYSLMFKSNMIDNIKINTK